MTDKEFKEHEAKINEHFEKILEKDRVKNKDLDKANDVTLDVNASDDNDDTISVEV